MIISVKNTLEQNALLTSLGDSYAAGAGTLGVQNTNSFQPSWTVQIGKVGEERTENQILASGAVSGTTLVLVGSTNFDHPVDTPVYGVKFDQLIFKRSTSGTTGTAVVITNGTVSITPDSVYTQFDDTSAANGYAYKVCYKNSVTGEVSNDSSWLTTSGYSFYSLFKLRDRIRNKLFSIGYLKTTDNQINDWINEWLEMMNNTAVDVNQDYNLGTMDIAYGTNGLATITATDFKEIRKIDYTPNGSDFYRATKMHLTDFLPNEQFNETHPYYYMTGDSTFGRKPDAQAGTARVTYYKLGLVLSGDTDEIPVVMRGYTKSFVDYGVSQSYYFDGSATMGDRFIQMANAEKESFRSEITPRSKTGPTYIKLSDPIDADEMFGYLQ